VRYAWLLLLLGCPAGETPPPQPPAPPPLVVVAPPPLPPPPPPPRVKLVALELFPESLEVKVGGTVLLCAYYRFGSGHVGIAGAVWVTGVSASPARVSLLPADPGACHADYHSHYTLREWALTDDEEAWMACRGRYALDKGCPRRSLWQVPQLSLR